ncbi:MAG: DUF4845 domain-containing protein [Enterobacterales bacterium]|nr:DUF4845 domain-containing protein [Enterobacterales bacterium]
MNNQKQQGATLWTFLFVLSMFVFIAMLAFKVVPIYTEQTIIRSALQDLVDTPEFNSMSNQNVIRNIRNRLKINNVRGMDCQAAFKPVTTRSGEKIIKIDYEQRAPIMYNLFAVVHFDEEIHKSRKN